MQRYFAKEYSNNVFTVLESDWHHITKVMRMQNGDNVEVVYDNKLYIAEITLNPFIVTKKEEVEVITKHIPNVTLILPLLKEQKMDYILQKATELGVNKFIFIETERNVIKMDNQKERKKIERWMSICKEASEQSKRLTIPQVEIRGGIKDLNDISGKLFVCSTTEKENKVKQCLLDKYDNLTFIIGPEGGLSPREEEILNEMGFLSITLGNNIMRVETVPLYLLSVVNYEYME